MLPDFRYIRDKIKRERNKNLNYVAIEKSDIPESLKKDAHGNILSVLPWE
jgi:hypothetical protein